MRKTIIIIISVIISNILVGQNAEKSKSNLLQNAISKLQNDKSMKNAGITLYAVDIKTGEVIANLNSDMALAPASTLKLLTTATALEILGSDFKFKTILEYSGKIDASGKKLNGNLIIKGGGDPTLGSKYFENNKSFIEKWTESVKKAGIQTISGNIIGDAQIYDTNLVPQTWSWENIGNYFGAGACGLSVSDNFYTLHFRTGQKKGDPTEIYMIEPKIEGLTIYNKVISDNISFDDSYVFGAPYSYLRYIRGKLPLARTSYKVKGSMPDPALFTAQELYTGLKKSGITVNKNATTFRISPELYNSDKNTILKTLYSPSLISIIKKTNYRSINLFAEHMLNHIGLKINNQGNTKSGAKAVAYFWKSKGMDTDGLSINDGSGLSRYNTITAKQLVFMLNYMKTKSKNSDKFVNSIPVAGESGTVKYILKNTNAQGNMHAKSGSIRNIRAYAGYVKTKSGRDIAFAFMINNYNCTSKESVPKSVKILKALADYNK